MGFCEIHTSKVKTFIDSFKDNKPKTTTKVDIDFGSFGPNCFRHKGQKGTKN